MVQGLGFRTDLTFSVEALRVEAYGAFRVTYLWREADAGYQPGGCPCLTHIAYEDPQISGSVQDIPQEGFAS